MISQVKIMRPIIARDTYKMIYQDRSKEFLNAPTEELQKIINHYEHTLRGRLARWFALPESVAIYDAAINELQRRTKV